MTAAAPVTPPSKDVVEDDQRFERIAAIAPRPAVLEAFTVVDNVLKEHLIQVGVAADASGIPEVRSTDATVEAERIGLLDNARSRCGRICGRCPTPPATSQGSSSPDGRRSTTAALRPSS
jgi:hypothetical protein